MKDELIALIPEFELITDEDLREKTLEAYIAAMNEGGWKPGDLMRLPFTLLIDPCPATMLEHIRGVTGLAVAIAKGLSAAYPKNPRMKVDYDLLVSGALLHDVGKLVEYEEKDGKFIASKSGKLLRHPNSGMGIAKSTGLPDEVLHAIVYHSHEGDGRRGTIESIIINHADFLNFEPLKLP
ncbi:MAG TPA: HD domain-containing protein [Firmicutes bacterium]|nr:HD domain-containing protein [Bacillota bacterium]